MLQIKATKPILWCFRCSLKTIFMSRSTAALLIAIMFHILLFVLFFFLLHLKPEVTIDKPKEHRIKVALKEKPKTSKKSAAVENKQQPLLKAPPIPKGKQMKKLPQKKTSQTRPVTKSTTPPKVKQKTKPIEKQQTVEKKKAYVKQVTKKVNKDINITTKPVQKSGLYAKLSKKQKSKSEPKKKMQAGTQIGSDFKEAYGEAFGKLSAGEQKYIIDNQERMRRITQEQLNRLAPVNIPRNLHVNAMNIIEFYLHPNGDISGLKVISPSGQQILDDTSLQTVEYSYHRYPLPEQKTLVRYKVGYYLGGSRY